MMFQREIVQFALRDSRGRFTGEHEFQIVSRWQGWQGWDRIPGMAKAQLALCPIILWLAVELCK